MDNEIESQIIRAKELLDELNRSYESDLLSQNVSEKSRNLTQELLSKMRNIFDQSMYKFLKKKSGQN